MIGRAIGVAGFAVCAALGIAFQDAHVRLSGPGQPADQQLLAHRDSAYTSMSYVASQTGNYLQLRFFERVEGGIALHPTWQDMIDAGYAHLKPDGALPVGAPAARAWPRDLPLPNPGAVNDSAYISLFSAGVLLNDRVMAAAGGDPERAKASILIVGLGSGIGIAHLAANLPLARITVVDIDAEVIAIVRDHYPLLRWLEQQGRVELVARDARQFIRYEAPKRGGFDLILLDAYTAGSTIPPHLMTREFFGHCASGLREGGILAANVIGSYGVVDANGERGAQYRTLGGALRSMHAELPHVRCVPVINSNDILGGKITYDRTRNNLVFAARHPIAPGSAAWNRLSGFTPFAGLPAGRWKTRLMTLHGGDLASSSVDADAIERVAPGLIGRFGSDERGLGARHLVRRRVTDSSLVGEVRNAVAQLPAAAHGGRRPLNWSALPGVEQFALLTETDVVLMPQETWRLSFANARDVLHDAETLVGPADPPRGERSGKVVTEIPAPPLYTDQRPNADIWNR